MRRARLILNPSSGRERGPEHLEALNAALRGRFDDVATTVTNGDGDAEQAAVAAAEGGCDALFVAGGDGTVNEAMNGLSAARALADVAVGIIRSEPAMTLPPRSAFQPRQTRRSGCCSKGANSGSISAR